jgi:hypothetical protein
MHFAGEYASRFPSESDRPCATGRSASGSGASRAQGFLPADGPGKTARLPLSAANCRVCEPWGQSGIYGKLAERQRDRHLPEFGAAHAGGGQAALAAPPASVYRIL